MTRRSFIWSALALSLLPFILIYGPLLASHLVPGGCSGSQGPCLGYSFVLFGLATIVLPILLLIAFLILVWRRCKAVGLPRPIGVLAGPLAMPAAILPMNILAVAWNDIGRVGPWALVEQFAAPICLAALLVTLALLSQARPGPPDPLRLVSQIGLWISAPFAIVANGLQTPINLLRDAQLASHLPSWSTALAVGIFLVCSAGIVVAERARRAKGAG